METFEPNRGNEEISKRWDEAKIFEAKDGGDKNRNRYILDMFPYPSGDGLHVGHVESYTGSDILSRYYRLKGYNVLHPIGWDAFGLPAENYAIKKGMHPKQSTDQNIANFTRQIKSLGFSYDWSREINTSAPEFYKWTQWLFLKLYDRGLAYKKKAKVNWCDSCQTVLANEQVIDGECERCGNEVIQKDLEQWFFKITDYAERLLNDLDGLDWPEHIKQMQRNWIGRSEGAEIKFPVILNPSKGEESDLNIDPSVAITLPQDDDKCISESITVFTTRPDTLYGVTYMVLAPEHSLVDSITTNDHKVEVDEYRKRATIKSTLQRTDLSKEKTGVFTGAYALHPLTKKKLPIWIADYVVEEYGGGAVMAVPAHDERDFEFAKKYDLPIVEVISSTADHHDINNRVYTGTGKLINSDEFNGMLSLEAKKEITKKVGGKWKTTYRLRDWLVSRQRYWGAPIPIIYCDECGMVPVPEDQLPIKLPEDVDFRPTGESPLARSESFHSVKCPKCGASARRESDTMDTFVCSSWYFLRYCDPKNEDAIFSREKVKQWMPVDIYIGGAEHAVLHLLYSRFITKFLVDEKIIDIGGADEPFAKLRNQGMILGPDSQKMSKSRGNVINPDEIVENYGADALRLYEMFLGPFDQQKAWNTQGIEGVVRFLKKAEKLIDNNKEIKKDKLLPETTKLSASIAKKIESMQFNTAVSDFMIYVNVLGKKNYSRNDLEIFAICLSPFAPFTAEKIWKFLSKEGSVAGGKWIDAKAKDETSTCTVVIQVDGKVRANTTIKKTATEDEVFDLAMKNDKVMNFLSGKNVIKKFYIPCRVVNIVTK